MKLISKSDGKIWWTVDHRLLISQNNNISIYLTNENEEYVLFQFKSIEDLNNKFEDYKEVL